MNNTKEQLDDAFERLNENISQIEVCLANTGIALPVEVTVGDNTLGFAKNKGRWSLIYNGEWVRSSSIKTRMECLALVRPLHEAIQRDLSRQVEAVQSAANTALGLLSYFNAREK